MMLKLEKLMWGLQLEVDPFGFYPKKTSFDDKIIYLPSFPFLCWILDGMMGYKLEGVYICM